MVGNQGHQRGQGLLGLRSRRGRGCNRGRRGGPGRVGRGRGRRDLKRGDTGRGRGRETGHGTKTTNLGDGAAKRGDRVGLDCRLLLAVFALLVQLLLLVFLVLDSGFADEVGEFGQELVHGVTTLTLVEDVGGTTLLEGSKTRDGVDIFAVEHVDTVQTKDILGRGGCCGRGGCSHCVQKRDEEVGGRD